jgi:hypothetical protein
MEEGTNKWKDVLLLWIRKINIVKISILPRTIYKFNTIPVKIVLQLSPKVEKISKINNKWC